MQGARLASGGEVNVAQAQWQELAITAYSDSGCVCSINRSKPGSSQKESRAIRPDFLLIRSVTHALAGQDSRNLLYAFMFAGIPAVNSLESVYCCLERPLPFGELMKSQRRLGSRFPIIPQTLYPSFRDMIVTPSYPLVVKVGHAHAGYGKMRLENHHQFEDFRSVCALTTAYVTAEPFIDYDYDIRIQKIGQHFRAFHRRGMNWKGNVGTAIIEDAPMTPEYQLWIDEASSYFGGLDICALDVLHRASDGAHFILELNDSAIGLVHSHEKEDYAHMRELVLEHMNHHFCGTPLTPPRPRPTAAEPERPAPQPLTAPSSSSLTTAESAPRCTAS